MRRWVGRGVVREAKDDVTREIYYALIEDQKTYAAEVSAVHCHMMSNIQLFECCKCSLQGSCTCRITVARDE
jgi:hypothetical protein